MKTLQMPWPNPFLPTISDSFPPLELRGTGGAFTCLPGSPLRMYVCGITPYDATHLGHAATYLTFDLINRYQRLSGSHVDFVENITDIDEPLLERAKRDATDWQTLAQRETDLFTEDMAALRVFAPDWFVPATQTMDLVEEAISAMDAHGFVYRLENDLYFRTSNFLDELPYSMEDAISLFAERGGDPGRVGKEHPLDSVLWIANRDGEPGWESRHGFGRPGWHIECAVISLRYLLGPNFINGDATREALIDIQGGGRDLIFPHHFMSAIQVRAMTGQRFSRGYVHTGLIGLNGEKMSKSKGNLVFVSTLLTTGVDPMVIRYSLLKSHYSEDRMWSDELLAEGEADVLRIRQALSRNEVAPTEEKIKGIISAIGKDLNTPGAIEQIMMWVTDTESDQTGGSTGEMSRALDSILGLAF